MPGKDAKPLVLDGSSVTNAVLVANPFESWQAFRLCAPTLVWSEVSSAISQMRWRGDITAAQARDAVQRLVDLPISPTPSIALAADAIELAHTLGWAKSYDAEYVILAQRLNAPLVTADARLFARVRTLVETLAPLEVATRPM